MCPEPGGSRQSAEPISSTETLIRYRSRNRRRALLVAALGLLPLLGLLTPPVGARLYTASLMMGVDAGRLSRLLAPDADYRAKLVEAGRRWRRRDRGLRRCRRKLVCGMAGEDAAAAGAGEGSRRAAELIRPPDRCSPDGADRPCPGAACPTRSRPASPDGGGSPGPSSRTFRQNRRFRSAGRLSRIRSIENSPVTLSNSKPSIRRW